MNIVKLFLLKLPMVYKMLFLLHNMYFKFLFFLFSAFPIKTNKIVFSSFGGGDFSDNPKYILEELISLPRNLDCVWLIKKDLLTGNHLPNGVRAVPIDTAKSVYELATASVWVDNIRKPLSFKRSEQFFLQTWHGMPGLKKIEQDCESLLAPAYVRYAKIDAGQVDIMLANSNFEKRLMENSFWYRGPVLLSGTPRNDIFYCYDGYKIHKKVRKYFNLSNEQKIVLYAPTFRDNGRTDVFDINYQGCIEACNHRFGGDHIMLLRLHPNLVNQQILVSDVNVATSYPDMQELLFAADILITDYSSSMFDFMLTGRPCFICACDYVEYTSLRGAYFNLSEIPFPSALTAMQISEIILNFDEIAYQRELNDFKKKIMLFEEGTASKKAVELICSHISCCSKRKSKKHLKL